MSSTKQTIGLFLSLFVLIGLSSGRLTLKGECQQNLLQTAKELTTLGLKVIAAGRAHQADNEQAEEDGSEFLHKSFGFLCCIEVKNSGGGDQSLKKFGEIQQKICKQFANGQSIGEVAESDGAEIEKLVQNLIAAPQIEEGLQALANPNNNGWMSAGNKQKLGEQLANYSVVPKKVMAFIHDQLAITFVGNDKQQQQHKEKPMRRKARKNDFFSKRSKAGKCIAIACVSVYSLMAGIMSTMTTKGIFHMLLLLVSYIIFLISAVYAFYKCYFHH